LFYVALDERLMAVAIRLGSDGRSIKTEEPVPLFTASIGGAVQFNLQYVVSANGQRFLLNTAPEEPILPIALILNWTPKS
jgi:hypothetical protein